MNVTRQEALDFLNTATRNWSGLPPLEEDDIGDVASALLAFVIARACQEAARAPDWWQDEDAAEREFTEYFVRNYPGPDTIIYDPKWHAPKLFRAAKLALLATRVDASTAGGE